MMNDFIQHIVARHTDPGKNIQPRARGIFEPLNNKNVPFQTDSFFDPEATNGDTQTSLQNSPFFQDHPGALTKDRSSAFGSGAPETGSPKTSTFFQNTAHPITATNNKQASFFKKTPAPENRDDTVMEGTDVASHFHKGTAQPRFTNPFTDKGNRPTPDAAKKAQQAKENTGNQLNAATEPAIKPVQKQGTGVDAFYNPRYGSLQGTVPLRQNTKPAHPQNAYPVRPVIKVTIGRVEVKAIVQHTAPPKNNGPAKPKMSLDDYLKNRNNPAS